MARTQITEKEVTTAIDIIKAKLESRLIEKGRGTFSSNHEIYGILAEEFNELLDAVTKNRTSLVAKELVDIAVGAIFGLACIKAEKTDW